MADIADVEAAAENINTGNVLAAAPDLADFLEGLPKAFGALEQLLVTMGDGASGMSLPAVGELLSGMGADMAAAGDKASSAEITRLIAFLRN